MIKDIITYVAIGLSLLAIILTLTSRQSPKIAYVKSGKVLEEYDGMKEAKGKFGDKLKKWQENIDTLTHDLRTAFGRYNAELSTLSKEERQTRELYLQKQEENLQKYEYQIQQQAKEEDEKINMHIISQLNKFLKKYGEEEGYDLILGTTQQGSILYGSEAYDITGEVIKKFNIEYLNMPSDSSKTQSK